MFERVSLTGTMVGTIALVAAFAFAGCGGDDSPPDEESSGGSSSGTGGSGAGGTDDGSGGTDATGGDTAAAGADSGICTHTVPPDERITDFSTYNADGSWGDDTSLTGGSFDYGAEGYVLDMAVEDEALHVTSTVPVDQYSGFGFWFGPCTDVSAYRGISFTLGGDAGNTQLVFQVQTSKNYPIDTANEKGECTGSWSDGCASNEFTIEEIPETPTTIEVLWEDLSGGQPESTVTPSELLGIQWQFNCGSDGDCTPDVTFDDVKFMQ